MLVLFKNCFFFFTQECNSSESVKSRKIDTSKKRDELNEGNINFNYESMFGWYFSQLNHLNAVLVSCFTKILNLII